MRFHPTWLRLSFAFVIVLSGQLVGQDAGYKRTFQELFDGSLAGWHGNNPHQTAGADDPAAAIDAQQEAFLEHWSVDGNELVNDGHGPYATTDESYGDIELLLEYKTVAKADSGIYLRGTPQIQIWDTTKEGGKWDRNANMGSGGLFNNTKGAPGQLPLRHADKPFGEWNRFRIQQIGSRTWVELNDVLVVDGAIMENYWDKDRIQPLPAEGPIHLQTHGGEIRWRNILLRKIQTQEAISRLRGDDAKLGFKPIFNGQDLTGWTGATSDYEVVDGAIVCKPNRGGILFTERQYENFMVRLEFKLPPGGNNGLAIRYPGHDTASYHGMCELQVLDNHAEKYARLDPRQYHGSVYGMAAAHRGYLRPAGEWNYQEVTVDGSRIRVELNGTIIVDADVSTIEEFMGNSPHPGKDLLRGHFGFCGHQDPVAFRRVSIKELPPTPELAAGEPAGLKFQASFDGTTDAQVFTGHGRLQVAESTKREKVRDQPLPQGVSLVEGAGRHGSDALGFQSKTSQVLCYEGIEVGYSEADWQGTVSLWLKLDPDKQLEPGFCDPIQITQRGWNDAALFVDFDKELPRDFRLGVFSDYRFWNPADTAFDEIPVHERPMVVVERPPFSSEEWTHVCFTWENINASNEQPSVARLFLNGKLQGELQKPLKFGWDPQQAGIMLGLNYIGLMDDLSIYDRALPIEQVQWLASH